jgi:hypothetical protein
MADIDALRAQQPFKPTRTAVIHTLLWWALENFPKETPLPKIEE